MRPNIPDLTSADLDDLEPSMLLFAALRVLHEISGHATAIHFDDDELVVRVGLPVDLTQMLQQAQALFA